MQTADEVKERSTKLREALVSRGHSIKYGQCLDVISKIDGYADWNAYTADISAHLNRAEQFMDEMLEAGKEGNYKKFTQRYEAKYLVHFTEKVFLKDRRATQEDFGDYLRREFLGCVFGDTDPETKAKYPDEIRHLWRGVFEKSDVLMIVCIYNKNGTYHVSGFNLN